MRIAIVGTGYVGLVSGACLADVGHDVTCVDVEPGKVAAINSGRPTIHEPGLSEVLARTAGRSLRATTDLAAAVRASEMTFIAVGTPARDGRIDLEQVRTAASEIGRALRTAARSHVVVVKSTVVPGTTDGLVRESLAEASGLRPGHDFGLGVNPEFLTEGRAVQDFTRPDRIVIGGIDVASQQVLNGVYAPFSTAPRIVTNNTTAEFIKYASNAVLATMISFSNELSRLCAAVGGADIVDVLRGVHASGYFTSTTAAGSGSTVAPITSFLEAGCGFGGSCLPKDVTALIGQGRDLGIEMPLLRAVLDVNRTQPDELLQRLQAHLPDLRGRTVTVLGIAFKPDTDDVRESPALPILRRLRALGASVTAYDPVARLPEAERAAGVQVATSLEGAIQNADAIVLVTRWSEFDQLAQLLAGAAQQPVIIDGRRVLDPSAFERYEGIGRAVGAGEGR
jgi:UDPglucose 6-dehydrogenase